MIRLEDLGPCFQGIVPAQIATCDRSGEPNVTYLSHVYYLDPRRVALSCQFFNKTRRNVEENPLASVLVWHPLTFEAYRLRLRFDHAETEGPLFESMALRIQVIASHTGMAGIFALRSADVYEVLSVEHVEGLLLPEPGPEAAAPPPLPPGPLTELRGLQLVSERVARASDLRALLEGALEALDELFGLSHALVFVPAGAGRLVAVASRGYPASLLGAEARVGEGLVGCVAERRRAVRVAKVGAELRYGQAVRARVAARGEGAVLGPELPLPGLTDAQAQLALPLLAGERLAGVLVFESRDPLRFGEWDEAFLGVVASLVALSMNRVRPADAAADGRTRVFCYYRNDACVFVDGEYLVRNVPGKILWKLLGLNLAEGRSEFTNRELRLDPGLGLPPLKDNLESRLILLRRRLQEKCPDVRLVPVGRGRFALQLDCAVSLVEKECG